jgi:voltage-gated potassium channel
MVPFWFMRGRHRARTIIERPSIGRALIRAGLVVAAIIVLHVLAMMLFEQMPAFDGFWLTLTTLFTVGYGDLAAKTWEGRWATILLLYLLGIFTLANFASQWFEWRADARIRKWRGTWRWRMKDHLLILNSPLDNAERYFERLLGQLRQSHQFAECPILIITRTFGSGLPEPLARLGACHHHAWGLDFEALQDSAPGQARAIAILAKSEGDPTSDSVTLDAITRVRKLSRDAHLVVECIDDRNRDRMFAAGASAVVRPTRVYPEILARALAHPGSEKVLEEILDAGGAECMRIDAGWEGSWKDLAARLAEAGVGTALGYESREGRVMVNPRPEERILARAVFALVTGEPVQALDRATEALRAR